MTLATWITLSRLLGVPIILYALHQPTVFSQWLGCGIVLVAASTDWLDGYVARRWNQVTDLGKVLDPLVDKLLVIAPLLSLLALRRVPVVGVFLIIARELTIAGWRVNQRTVSGANAWGKLKTVVQILAIALLIAPLNAPWNTIGIVFFWFAVGLTLISGWIYLWPQLYNVAPDIMAPDIVAPAGTRGDSTRNPAQAVSPDDSGEDIAKNWVLLQNLQTFQAGFLSRVSHELRGPLNGIIGVHQLILTKLCDSPEEEREFLEHANQSSLKLIGMLDTILKVAKVEAGKTPLKLTKLSVCDLLHDVADLTAMQAADRTIPLALELPSADLQVLGDEAWLRQMLLNAVSELMEAMLQQSQTMGMIKLSATSRSDQVELWVAAKLPFQAWAESVETLEQLRNVPLPASASPASPAIKPSPELSLGLRHWLDDKILQQMQGSLAYFEREPGWACIQFTLPAAIPR